MNALTFCSRFIVLLVWVVSARAVVPPEAAAQTVELKARYMAMQPQLARNAYQKPIQLESSQNPDKLKGEIHAVVSHPYAEVSAALGERKNWCDILILHLNVKACQASPESGIVMHVGKKFDQPLSDAYEVKFSFRVVSQTPDYLRVELDASEGPLGTRDYRIVLQATALEGGKSFVNLSYAYGYGMAARLAMKAYLSTVGSEKVGFSVVGRTPEGQPVYIRGVRGVVERNTMRYYLAIEAYLDARSAPPGQQLEKRLYGWYAATERHALQLHEMDQEEYVQMKRKEARR